MTTEGGAFVHLRARLREGGTLLQITLDQPKGNVLTRAMMAEITAALEQHRDEPGLRLVLLEAAGKHFSFGASVEEHRHDQAPAMLRSFHTLIRRVAGYPVPVAALVQGSCLGGAFELVLVCHLVLAASDARFSCPEIQLGVLPPVLAAVGRDRLGGPATERLVLTGSTLDAGEARSLGLAAEVFPPDIEPHEAAIAWFREKILPLSAFSLRQATRALRESSGFLAALDRSLEATERLYVDHLIPSHDGNEGIEAFLEKRKPAWRDQ